MPTCACTHVRPLTDKQAYSETHNPSSEISHLWQSGLLTHDWSRAVAVFGSLKFKSVLKELVCLQIKAG